MKKVLIYLFLVVAIVVLSPIKGIAQKKFHLLLFINTEEPDRQKDRKLSATNTIDFFKEISTLIGYTLELQYCKGQKYTGTIAKQVVDDLTVNDGDIVVFYYIGHGRNDGEEKWPTLSFRPSENNNSTRIKMDDIMGVLAPKTEDKAKLCMIISECCNNYMKKFNAPIVSYSSLASYKTKLKNLFCNKYLNHYILVSSSIQGQLSYSWSNKGTIHGICFRQAFIDIFDEKDEPTWTDIMKRTKKYVLEESDNKQEPQSFIESNVMVR